MPITSWLTCALIALSVSACSTVGHHRVAPAGPEPAALERPTAPVLLIAVDGLRADVFNAYLQELRREDLEPEWRSGLALLAQEHFRLASSTRAETPVPSFGIGPSAALATGQYPDATGLPGSVFYASHRDGRLHRYDFERPADASRIYFQPSFAPPSAEHPPLLEGLLRAPTLYERLRPTHRATVIFHTFGRGAEWFVPGRASASIRAVVDHQSAAAAVPLFDRGARDAAVQAVLSDAPPDLLTLYFRGVLAQSCFQRNADCDARTHGDLQAIQRNALQQVDKHLWKILYRLRAAHPDIFARTTLLLVGTGAVADHAPQPNGERHLLDGPAILKMFSLGAEDGCTARLAEAHAAGDLVLAANGATAHLYLRQVPLGQGAPYRAALKCLSVAIEANLEQPWLSGAAWMPPEALHQAGSRAARFKVALQPNFQRRLPAHRRARLLAKIRRMVDDGTSHRTGDAILFAAEGWLFVDEESAPTERVSRRGGIDAGTMEIPFLVASRALSEHAATELRASPVELPDVVPTVLTLLHAPAEARLGLERPSLLRWRAGRLEVLAADRSIAAPALEIGASFTTDERAQTLGVGVDEPKKNWPPDELRLRIGGQVYAWDADTGRFPEGSPCTFAETDTRRRWRCERPIDPKPGLMVAAAYRFPAGDETDDEDERAFMALEPIIFGSTRPKFSDAHTQIGCVASDRLRLQLRAQDAMGLGRVEVLLADAYGGGTLGRTPGGLVASAQLGGVEPSAACAVDPSKAECVLSTPPTTIDAEIEIPFTSALLDHQRRAIRLLGGGGASGDVGRLWARFARAGLQDATAPDEAFLVVRICNIAGRCVQRPLISDEDYEARLELGCP